MGIDEGVKSIFDKYANQYNQSCLKLIHCFDDFHIIKKGSTSAMTLMLRLLIFALFLNNIC